MSLSLALALFLLPVLGAEAGVVPPGAQCPGLPAYPPSERASGRSGKVVVRVTLDERGAVQALVVAAGMGEVFDALALASARACTFTPATREGVGVAAQVELSVDFVAPPPPGVLEGTVSGELDAPVKGASVTAAGVAALTDEAGRFRLELDPAPEGDFYVVVASPEYGETALAERVAPGEARQVRYRLKRQKIAESRVYGSKLLPDPPEVDATPQVSRFHITRADIDRTPGALEDIARVVQDLPGVVADPDLLATFFVRGGGPDEVIYYLDGVPLANPFHLNGFASIFNPMLIDAAEFYAGSTPARYEPALSGVLEVRYATGETARPKVNVDVSMHTAKARVDTPTGIEGLSVLLAARRSYFELYFAGLRQVGIVGDSYVAPDISEYLGRAHYRRGRHQLTLTYLRSSDGLDFLVEPGEEVLVDFAGNLKLANTVQLGILQYQLDFGKGYQGSVTAALTRDANEVSVASQTVFARAAARNELFVRGDLTLPLSELHRFQVGASFARRRFQFEGDVEDTRAVAPWASMPFIDTGNPTLNISPGGLREIFAAYVEHVFKPAQVVSLEAGMRLQADVRSAQSSYALRGATSVTLPTATVAKASFGMTTQFQPNPLLLDPGFGNPSLSPERSTQLVVGLEQPLPIQALVRLEVFGKWLDYLTVNPDSPEGLAAVRARGEPAYQSVGRGFARGVDGIFLGRAKHVGYGVAVGLVSSERTNPLATGRRTYPAPWDQRFTGSAHVSYTPNEKWLFSVRGSYHTGRPVTPVLGFVRDEAGQRYLPRFGETNSERYPGFYELSVRGERHFGWGPLKMAVFAEVLNVTNAQNIFANVWDEGDFAAGVEPQQGAFNHLPIRPFLGLRGEY